MHCTVHGAEVAHGFLIGHFSQSQPLCLRSVVTSSRGQSFFFFASPRVRFCCASLSAGGELEIAIMFVLLD